MACFSHLFRREKREKSPNNKSIEVHNELSSIQNVNIYSYRELRNATEDFSPTNKIGEGGFGSVYKGTLRGGLVVAIKVLSAESRQGVSEFLTEIKVISCIEHENLVKLHGCCVEGNHRILVYGYLENNSLAKTLLGGGQSGIHFSWRRRAKICIGVARGLAFLHEEVKPHIIHRDIKASNVLLDKDLTPKIADFGLAKLLPLNVTHISTCVAGTIGYVAPEYATRGRVTRKADIYSFGVLLLEIVAGRRNKITQLPIGERYLLERTWELYDSGELVGLVDTSLNGDYDVEEACRFLKIGLVCTQEAPGLRPSMSTILRMLTAEISLDNTSITKPGFISDLMDKKGTDPKEKGAPENTWSTMGGSSNVSLPDNSLDCSTETTQPTMTFTSIYDRSP